MIFDFTGFMSVSRLRTLILCSLIMLFSFALSAEEDQPLEGVGQSVTVRNVYMERAALLQAQGKLTEQVVERARADLENAKLNKENLNLEHSNRQQQLQTQAAELGKLQNELRDLKKQPASGPQLQLQQQRIGELETAIQQLQQQFELGKTQQEQLESRLPQARQRLNEAEQWYEQALSAYQNQRDQSLDGSLLSEYEKLQNQAVNLRQQLDGLPADGSQAAQRWGLEARVLEAEERASLLLYKLERSRLSGQLQRLKSDTDLLAEDNAEPWEKGLQQVNNLLQKLDERRQMLDSKQTVLQRQLSVLSEQNKDSKQRADKEWQQRVKAVIKLYQQEQAEFNTLYEDASETHKNYKENAEAASEQALFSRRHLPKTWEGWQRLLTEVVHIPDVAWAQLQALLRIAVEDFKQVSWFGWVSISGGIGLWLFGLFWASRWLHQREAKLCETGGCFTITSVSLGLRLLSMNFSAFALTGILGVILLGIQPAQSTVVLTIALSALWLSVKLPIDLAYLLLIARNPEPPESNVSLYRQLRWLLLSDGVLITFTLLIHVWPYSLAVRELTDTLLMLFLSLMAWPSLRLRRMVLNRLENRMEKGYWLWLMRVLSLLLTISILAVGFLGVIGYINLGWLVARNLTLIFLVLGGALVLEGLIGDIVDRLKEYAMRNSVEYGLLWSQDILPLLRRLLRLGVLIAAISLLLHLTGWQTDSGWLKDVLVYSLFSIGETHITVAGVLLSGFVLFSVLWFAGWMKRITYRWIYSSVTDLGIRHSLSVFTQYAVLIVGGIIALRLLGLDLTTFTVFAGALGVGLGFGLQNIANNFVSGLLLLAERPLRTGDLVEIGGPQNAGEVTRIGIRSLTICTWDNQEVIVPNSQVISESFINWTHSNDLSRTVLHIGVSYNSNPRTVKKVFEEILEEQEEILPKPAPGVFVSDFADSAIIFRIQYHTLLRKSSKFHVRSEFLADVYERFAKEGIEIPYPQQDVHIRDFPHKPLTLEK